MLQAYDMTTHRVELYSLYLTMVNSRSSQYLVKEGITLGRCRLGIYVLPWAGVGWVFMSYLGQV